jgi:hypothetical protein
MLPAKVSQTYKVFGQTELRTTMGNSEQRANARIWQAKMNVGSWPGFVQ